MSFSFFRPRIVLMIGDDGIVVVPCKGANRMPFFVAAEDRRSLPEIFEFIARHPQARITLFADNMAQDYRSDSLPRLNFIDRAKLANRRLKQNFPAARLTAGLRCRKSRDRVLMIGVHESNPVFAWADRLRARLPDIALLPVEGARLAAKLMPDAADGWGMTISRQRSGGFRQIVTFRGDLVFTRLTPLPVAGAGEDEAEIIARDIKASLDYLTRHGLREASALSVLLLMRGGIHTAQPFKNLPVKAVRSLPPFAAAGQLGLPFAPPEGDENADLLFAASLLASPRAALPMMLPEARQVWLTQNIRQWGMRVASVALLVVALFTLWRGSDLVATVYRAQEESARLGEIKQVLAQAQAHAVPVTEPLGRLRQALERQRIYARPVAMPWQGLDELAGGLGDDAKIVRLEWKKESDDTPDVFDVGLRVTGVSADRAEAVEVFTRAAQEIARAAADYDVSVIKPPYPALPQDAVTAEAANASADPVGEIMLRRKTQ